MTTRNGLEAWHILVAEGNKEVVHLDEADNLVAWVVADHLASHPSVHPCLARDTAVDRHMGQNEEVVVPREEEDHNIHILLQEEEHE